MVSIQIQQVTEVTELPGGNGITFSERIDDIEAPGLYSEMKLSRSSKSITRHDEI